MARKAQIQMRRDTAANWTSTNPTLASGEIGFETDANRIKIGDGSTAWASLAYLSGGAIGANSIINGDFFINQRQFTSGTANGTYNFDRWLQLVGGAGTTTYTPQTFTPGAAPVSGVEGRTYLQVVTASHSAAGDYGALTQRIESPTTFAGQSITVSFYAKASSGTPSIGVEAIQNFGSGGGPSSAVQAAATASTAISTSWARYNVQLSVPSISGKTLGTTGNTGYLGIAFWFSSGSTNATRASSIGIQNNTFSIWGVKVEPGSIATAFCTATRTIEEELAVCQRYYETSFPYGTAPANSGSGTTLATEVGAQYIYSNNTNTGPNGGTINFKATKRVAPTITFYGNSSTQWLDSTTGVAVATYKIGDALFTMYQSTDSTSRFIRGHWDADAEL